MTIGAVIFDFGNVLVGWDPENLYRQLIPDAAARRAFLRDVCSPAWNLEQDRGRSWAEAVASLSAQYPQHADLIAAFHARWDEMVSGPVAEGHDILDRVLAAGIPAYGLTNWSAETYETGSHHLPFVTRMKYVAVSGHLRMIKPDPEIYHHLLEKIALPPEQCAFIDDNQANIEAARKLGIKAVHFRNDGTALAELRGLGLGI
jgi:2-haloacid dehalogenase